ncbi:MAG: aldo/keto reductase [Rubrivivax sp. SCN 70-15]|nr:MAG: aldo/keto reductase [Rubrivivax sp. SCN 70-15]
MRQTYLPDGTALPVLGLGTWRLGEDAATRQDEIRTLHAAIGMGYRLIDTAEMYGEGGAEQVVGQAIANAVRAGDVERRALYVVSKVYPHNASRPGTVAACECSLRRLGLDYIDLYLLHWRGSHPLQETVSAMQALVAAGKIRHWGVSNFDVDDLQDLAAVLRQGDASAPGCATNQVYYSLSERGPEFSLLPWMRERQMPLMAYSPIDQGVLAADAALAAIAQPRGLTGAQVALAWITAQPGVLAIPKAGSVPHLQQNLAASGIELNPAERQAIEARFPRPRRKTPLAMI